MLRSEVELGVDQLSEVERRNARLLESRLPYVEGARKAWTQLYMFARCSEPRPSECDAALTLGEIWWDDMHKDAQRIFIESEAPDEVSIREWTIERRRFFERWLGTPMPVLTMELGVFRLSSMTGAVFEEWARCAGDKNAASRWKERTVE